MTNEEKIKELEDKVKKLSQKIDELENQKQVKFPENSENPSKTQFLYTE